MDQFLKGNYKVNRDIVVEPDPAADTKSELRKRVLASLGGSMVYVERDTLNWDGDEK